MTSTIDYLWERPQRGSGDGDRGEESGEKEREEAEGSLIEEQFEQRPSENPVTSHTESERKKVKDKSNKRIENK